MGSESHRPTELKLKHWIIDEEGVPQPEDRPSKYSYASPYEAIIVEDSAVIFVDNDRVVEAFCYYMADYGLFTKIGGRWYLLGLWDEWEEAMKLNKFLENAQVIKFRNPPIEWQQNIHFL